jgi:hypothetical protein
MDRVEMTYTVALEAARASVAEDRAKIFKETFKEVYIFLGEYIEQEESED